MVTFRVGIWPLALLLSSCAGAPDRRISMTRWYAKPPESVSRISAAILLEMGVRIESDERNGGEGKIETDQIVLRYRRVDGGGTQVTLDAPAREIGERMLDRITERIGTEDFRIPPRAVASLNAEYSRSMADCLAAAETVLEAFDLKLTERDVTPAAAHLAWRAPGEIVEARLAFRPPVTRVTFTVGAPDRDAADHRVRRFKEEFEKRLRN